MKVYEFQAKNILKTYDICVPQGKAISSPDNARELFRDIGGDRCIIKAQILAGGRGKSGGVRFANTPLEAQTRAADMLGSYLITRQTGHEGIEVKYVLIEEAVSPQRELYLAITIDRALHSPVLVACADGGIEIEEVAGRTPGKIVTELIDVFFGVHAFQARRIASKLQIHGALATKFSELIGNVFRAFILNDCSLLEINPLAITKGGEFCALDAKMDIDDNALYRHQEGKQFLSNEELSPPEALAKEYKLSYIDLKGTIGCLVNGAGLAMATMDIIKLHGGEPANFLDVGGDASVEQVTQACKIIVSDPKVKVILINIFGGIMKCDIVAEGIIHAMNETGAQTPLFIRLEGTNVDLARKILANSGLKIIPAKDMKDAAALAVSGTVHT
ncbi:MAG: ADP-forming succinate--CoA ligase subunit beta [Candidatus Brocadiaceae bacterium]|nr:ADP-forming succinate--CoA ligase subunit beta [Candidatus Brocadiaceae bacterium]